MKDTLFKGQGCKEDRAPGSSGSMVLTTGVQVCVVGVDQSFDANTFPMNLVTF